MTRCKRLGKNAMIATGTVRARLDKLTKLCARLPEVERRGWFGMRLDGPGVNWSEVENIVENSYRLAAPKQLLKTLGAPKP
jgi:hypothetical protein